MAHDPTHPLAHFLSSEPTARIEPAAFVAHMLAHHGTDTASLGVRQTMLVALLPELERRVVRAVGSPSPDASTLQRHALYNPPQYPFSVVGSPMGAPMAVMLLEQLIALGARQLLYLGFCGALDSTYRIGDCFLPQHAIREEGTSYHYLPPSIVPAAAPRLTALIQAEAWAHGVPVRPGPIWTTDAPYRETAAKIHHYQAVGVHAVDMEMAALFAVAAYRGCEVAALLLVSDECYHPTWNPGFGSERLRQGCREAVAVSIAVASRLAVATLAPGGAALPEHLKR